jgi:Flp pilus assembly protein TadD
MRIVLFLTMMLLASALTAQNEPAGTHAPDQPGPQDAVNVEITSAEAAMEKQDFTTAAARLKVLAAQRPTDARIQYDLGYALERNNDETGAATAYAAAIEANSALGEPRVALGLLDARAGRMDKAHKELAAAAALNNEAPVLRGRALRALAQMDEAKDPAAALDELQRAIQLTDEQAGDTLMAADLAERAGDDADAETAYRRVLATQPADIDAVAGLAHVLVKEKKNADAEQLLSDALKTHPDDPRLVSQLAVLYTAEDKTALAIPLMEKLRASRAGYADDAQMTEMLARLYEMNGDYAKAEPLYRAVVVNDAGDPEVLDALGTVLVKQQKYADAEDVLQKAVTMRERFASPQDWGVAEEHLGYAASKNQQAQLALDALKARDTVLPSTPSSLFLQAISYDALHQHKEAAQAYKTFLASANGTLPNEEFEARHRLVALNAMK